jgi:hypothetical protein
MRWLDMHEEALEVLNKQRGYYMESNEFDRNEITRYRNKIDELDDLIAERNKRIESLDAAIISLQAEAMLA